jgi:feruloyl esterase
MRASTGRSGMGHCYGGTGPTSISNGIGSDPVDPRHDLLLALERWVEQGIAPEMFVGTGKVPADPGETVSRPICPYPKTALYAGSGDTNDATNFRCAAWRERK